MMDLIARNTELNLSDKIKSLYQSENRFPEAIASAACSAAQNVNAKMIVVFTQSGFTAGLLSKLRPKVPIVAFTPEAETLNRMSLYWGVTPKYISHKEMFMESDLLDDIEKVLTKERLVRKGNNIVFVASSPFLGKHNVVRLHKV
jgi:pyruvate kinase